jgi:hypothetical protein
MTTFNPDILQSRETLARFLSGSDAVQEIVSAGPPARLNDRWDACILEFAHIAAGTFLTAVSYLLHAICLSDLSKRAWVISRHELSNASIIRTQQVFQQNLLVRSVNTYRKDTADYYLQPSLKAALPTGEAEVKAFNHLGLCRGMCFWFLQLYFKTQGRFANEEARITAVGRQFENGASRQAAFLHAVPVETLCDLLGTFNFREHAKISTQNRTYDQIIQEFQNCPQGIYGMYFSDHMMLYIRGTAQDFLFNPSNGSLKIASQHLFKKALEDYFENHDHNREIILDCYTPR